MLTVYSTHGSPGASTTAMHLAAHWAAAGHEVLLVEADPAGGSLSHNLGIQFTPGSASFLASGLPVLSNHLIDHAQDVLFENLHVMPAPASPAGARGIFSALADCADEFRTISENEMAVIIDGGRITADTAASALTTGAAGVVVVCRNNSQLSSLELLGDAVAAGPDGPRGFAVSIGKSPMDDGEWLEGYGLAFCGAIDLVADTATDLSAFLNRNKRKSKKWRQSLEQVAEALYEYAQPPVSDSSRRLRAAEPIPSPGTEPAGDSDLDDDRAAAGSQPSPGRDPADRWQPPAAPSEPVGGHGPPMAPDSGQPVHSHYLPPAPEHQPGHYLPPSAGSEALAPPAHEPTHPVHEPPPYAPTGYDQPHYAPPDYEPPDYEQPDYEPPHGGHPPTPHAPPAHEQPHPGYEPAPPPAHEQPHPDYEPAPSVPHGYEPAPYAPPAHQPAPYAPPAHEQPRPGQPPAPPPPGHEQAQPAHQPAPYAPPAHEQPRPGQPPAPPPPGHEQAIPAHQQPRPPADLPGPVPEMKPTGSFRDWAAKLHGLSAEDAAAQNRGG